MGLAGNGLIRLPQDGVPVEGFCEHSNGLLGFTKCWEILEKLRYGQLLRKDSAPWGWLVSYLVN
jgi:hypothetical protein